MALRGAEEACLDCIDCPEQVLLRVDQVFEVYREVYNRLLAIIHERQQGATCWMGIWHPEKAWYPVSSDFCCMVNREMFEALIVPGLERELDFLEGSMYHLDGPGALQHLDRILSFPKLNGVQWVRGAGAPPTRTWLDVLLRIQAAGKNVQVDCEEEDLEPLCQALAPEGVHLVIQAKDPSHAEALVEKVEGIYYRRRFR